jgi:hypothetical protein
MRWLTGKKVLPNTGDIRRRPKFAWTPTKIGRYTVWLEFYTLTEWYVQSAGWLKYSTNTLKGTP